MDALKNKKIIITQNALCSLAGSEIVTLELAEYLQQIGMKVVVFTWFLGNPIKEEFEKRNITVTLDEYDPILEKADYVWVHHQVVPFLVLDSLQKKTKKPCFIFLHMSALKDIYLEQPYVYDLERRISSKSLFMAEEAKELAKKIYYGYFEKYDDLGVFPNPVPERYLDKCEHSGELKKILIISNHPTREVDDACKMLMQKGIVSELLGKDGISRLISKDILEQYDLVITVAKSVQYCLCTGTPVYIYDHFGGCGYLNSKNIKKAAHNNYSGRGFSKKSPEQIADEIFNGYNDAYKFQRENIKDFQENYSIANNVKLVFDGIKPVDIKVDEKYISYVKSVEALVKDAVASAHTLLMKKKELESTSRELVEVQKNLKQILDEEERRRNSSISRRVCSKIKRVLLKNK